MSKCPFWSTKRERVSCSNKCPINPIHNNNELCPFLEHLSREKLVFKDILEYDFEYSQEANFDYVFSSYRDYK